MNICIVGAGYIDLTIAAVLADIGHTVYCTDLDSLKIDKFMKGIVYEGSCIPKDIKSLSYSASTKPLKMELLQVEKKINRSQLGIYMNKLHHKLRVNMRIAVWGAMFKENTDDIRYSQTIAFRKKLTKQGFQVNAYDPIVFRRNGLDKKTIEAYGFEFASVGRP